MELAEISIRNFRSHRSTGPVSINEKLILVGENNAGKSNFIDAIQLLFSNSSKPHTPSDFHDNNFDANIEIEATFCDLTGEERDTFSEYMDNGILWVKAVFPYNIEEESVGTKDLYVHKQVLAEDDLRNIGNKSTDEKQRLYEEDHHEVLSPFTSQVNWTGLNGASVERVVEAYGDSDEAETKLAEISPRGLQGDLHKHLPTLEVFQSTRNLDDATKTHSNALLGNLLNSALEAVPSEERNAIGDSLDSIKDRLNETDRLEPIEELESNLSSRLSDQMGRFENLQIEIDVPDLPDILEQATISIDDGFESDIDMMGSGFHMSFILALLLEIADRETQTMALCLEEPENNLHPHAQRKLYQILNRLSDQGFQVFLTTHSPNLIHPSDLDSIVRLHHEQGKSVTHRLEPDDLSSDELRKIETHLTPEETELFFARTVLFCEGPSERAVIPLLGKLLNQARQETHSLDALGISVVSVGGKENFEKFIHLSKSYGISSTVLIDNDREQDDDHAELVESLEALADQVVELSGDLEDALLTVVSNEVFCEALSDLSNFDKSISDFERAIENDPNNTRLDLMRKYFGKSNCTKPAFNRALAEQIDNGELPSEIERAIVQATELA